MSSQQMQYVLVFEWLPPGSGTNSLLQNCSSIRCILVSPIKYGNNRRSLPFLRNFAYLMQGNNIAGTPVLTNLPCDKVYGVVVAMDQRPSNATTLPLTAVETYGSTIKEILSSAINISVNQDFIYVRPFSIAGVTQSRSGCKSTIARIIDQIVQSNQIGSPNTVARPNANPDKPSRQDIEEMMYTDPYCYQ